MKTIKKINLTVFLILFLFSCSAGDKAAGAYNGTYSYGTGSTQTTVNVVSNGNEKVNIHLFTVTTNDVSVSLANNVVTFSYSNGAASVNGDIISIDGTLSGNNLTLYYVFYQNPTVTNSASFVGTKQ